jgi:DNA-binding CsgD family transcriptional regulator/tetratricopeptide (TPR) repeat protein
LRATLEWFDGHEETQFSLRLGWALQKFWELGFYWKEGHAWLQAALAKSPDMTGEARAKALVAAGYLAHSLGDSQARTYAEEGLSLLRGLGDKEATALALWMVGKILVSIGEYAMVRTYAEESLALFDELNMPWGRPYPLHFLSSIALVQGDLAQATVYIERNLTFYRQIGYSKGVGIALNSLGAIAQFQGNWKRAMACYVESQAICREAGDKEQLAVVLHNLGIALLHQGDARQAQTCFAEGLALSREIGLQYGIGMNLAGLAGVAAALGQAERSAHLFGAADNLFYSIGEVVEPQDRVEYDRNAAVARAQLGDQAFALAWNAGRAMPIEQAIALALEPLPETQHVPPPSSAPQPAVAAARYPAGLTAREVEVLRLIAQGLTDAQVAERLILSIHTVHAHLRSIYDKLEVSSRTAASRFAVDHHLV